MNEEKKNKLKELWSDSKSKAAIKLIGGFGLIILLVLYLNLTSSNSVVTPINEIEKQITNGVDNNSTTNDKNKLVDNNYAYNITIGYNMDNIDFNYNYSGKVLDNSKSIVKTTNELDITYKYENNHYYKLSDNNYTLTTAKDVYDVIDQIYISLDMIEEYIKLGNVEYETKYSDGSNVISYKIKVSELVLDYQTDEYINMEISKKTEAIKIKIDYTNLMKYYNSKITVYNVNIDLSDISKITSIF